MLVHKDRRRFKDDMWYTLNVNVNRPIFTCIRIYLQEP